MPGRWRMASKRSGCHCGGVVHLGGTQPSSFSWGRYMVVRMAHAGYNANVSTWDVMTKRMDENEGRDVA